MKVQEDHSRQLARQTSLFFLYMVPDEKMAFKFARTAWQKINKSVRFSNDETDQLQIINVTQSVFKRWVNSKGFHTNLIQFGHSQWSCPVPIDLWREFQQTADREVLLTTVYSQILGFQDSVIARGLRVSEGTVRYRTAKGLRLLADLKSFEARV